MLGAAVLVARFGRRWAFAGDAALLLALVSGTTLPDIDQFVPLLDHRDALTHSLLPALILLIWPHERERLRAVAAGLALGLALHMAADCFPEGMVGFATVKLPYFGSIGGWSYLWLALNAVTGGLVFGLLLDPMRIREVRRLTLLTLAAVIGARYLWHVDGGWWALTSLLLIGWGASKVASR